MQKSDDRHEVSQAIADVIESCLDRGMKLPLQVAFMSSNGSTAAARYVEGQENCECEILAEHIVDEGLALPIHMMVIDESGGAVRALLGRDSNLRGSH